MRGSQPILGELHECARNACQRLKRPVEHVQHHEPDGGAAGSVAEHRSEGGSQHLR